MKLTQERLMEVLRYDPATGVFHWLESRGRVKTGSVAGRKDNGYIKISIDGKKYFAHRLVWLFVHGYMPENEIDHIDRDKTNNRLENLREVSNQCNIRNTGNFRHNTSGVKGISWVKRDKKWMAHIQINGKTKHLGYYESFDEAVKARYRAEKAVGWAGCDSNSPAYCYLKENNLLASETH